MTDYCHNLVKWIRVLKPIVQAWKETERNLDDEHKLQGLRSYNNASESVMEFLHWVEGSTKLYQALKMQLVATRFLKVTELIEKALDEVSYGGIHALSTKDLEQIELVQDQIKEARGCIDSPADNQLKTDLYSAQNEMDPNSSVLIRLSEKLQIRTTADLENEYRVLYSISSRTEDVGDWFVTAITVLKKLKDYVLVIPDDFMCSITQDWMRDPVTVIRSGQTYERSAIQEWLDAGNYTCPNTRKPLSPKTLLIPNYERKKSIDRWCKSNSITELPKKLN